MILNSVCNRNCTQLQWSHSPHGISSWVYQLPKYVARAWQAPKKEKAVNSCSSPALLRPDLLHLSTSEWFLARGAVSNICMYYICMIYVLLPHMCGRHVKMLASLGNSWKKYTVKRPIKEPKKNTISHQIHVGSTHKKSVLAFSIDTFIYFCGGWWCWHTLTHAQKLIDSAGTPIACGVNVRGVNSAPGAPRNTNGFPKKILLKWWAKDPMFFVADKLRYNMIQPIKYSGYHDGIIPITSYVFICTSPSDKIHTWRITPKISWSIGWKIYRHQERTTDVFLHPNILDFAFGFWQILGASDIQWWRWPIQEGSGLQRSQLLNVGSLSLCLMIVGSMFVGTDSACGRLWALTPCHPVVHIPKRISIGPSEE